MKASFHHSDDDRQESPAHVPRWHRLRYRIDNVMASGSLGQLAWLGVLSLLLVLSATVVLSIARIEADEGDHLGFLEAFWRSLMRTLDPGTMGADEGWGFRLVALFVTVGGILIVSALIGVVATGLASRIDTLSRGRAPVAETRHTLILGWSPKVRAILAELALVSQSEHDRRVAVVMGPHDKGAMEEDIGTALAGLGRHRLRIVCRTGDPWERSSLSLTNLPHARAVIVVRSEGDDSDANVVKKARSGGAGCDERVQLGKEKRHHGAVAEDQEVLGRVGCG